MERVKYKILLALFGISLISSLILSLIPTPIVCSAEVGCDIVQTSSYNQTLGLKNSYYGLVIFTFLVFLTLSHIKKPTKNKKMLIHLAIIVSSLVALYFLYIQKFVLQAFCKYCCVTDVSVLLSLVVMIWKWEG
jgi:uncharacterized membrane protein